MTTAPPPDDEPVLVISLEVVFLTGLALGYLVGYLSGAYVA